MQKTETDNLYIVGLHIVTDTEFLEEQDVVTSKFLKWIIVENQSASYITEFVDIKTNTKYYKEGFSIGDLYVDMDTIVSMNTFTNKRKLSKEEMYIILEQFKREQDIEKIRMRKMFYKAFKDVIYEVGEEKVTDIVNKMIDNDDEVIKIDDAMDKIAYSLDIKQEKKVKKRNSR